MLEAKTLLHDTKVAWYDLIDMVGDKFGTVSNLILYNKAKIITLDYWKQAKII
jgi:hypothetical protein